MRARRLKEFGGPHYWEEGVTGTLTPAGFRIVIPCPVSPHYQFSIAGAVWEVWLATRDQIAGAGIACIVDISAFDKLPLPLISILSAMDEHLNLVGRQLSIVGRSEEKSLAGIE